MEEIWRSPHDERIAKFQQEPEHADDEEATVRRATVVSATVPEAKTQGRTPRAKVKVTIQG
jgi:hypothetical protein